MISEYPIGSILGEEELDAVKRVIESGDALTRGKEVGLFEKEFSEYCGSKYAVALSSCTSALKISTQLLHLGSEDEVIVQDNVFWALLVPLLERGVKIKCCDIEPDLNINPEKIEELITPKTKAVYLMHHGGNPADMDAIKNITREHDIFIVEDAAHAVGAEYKHKKIGSIGDITCFSFSTLKNMTTLGEGGMITTDRIEFKEMIEGLRTCYPFGDRVKRSDYSIKTFLSHVNNSEIGLSPNSLKNSLSHNSKNKVAFFHMGDSWEYDWCKVDEYGSAYRMSTTQAAVGRVQLKKLDGFIERRTEIAKNYNEIIEDLGFDTVMDKTNCKHAWHLYSFFTRNDVNNIEFAHKAKDAGLDIMIRFYPIHLGGIMRMNGHDIGECPVCERVWFKEQLALPIAPQMKDDEIEKVGEILRKVIT